MSRHLRKISQKTWIACGLFIWLATIVGVRAGGAGAAAGENSPPPPNSAQAQAQAPSEAPPAAAPTQNTYVGSEACLGCHDEWRKGYEGSAHRRVVDSRTPAAKQGCETCHGPGSLHSDDPEVVHLADLETAPADEVTAICTTCHNRGEHVLWDGSQHQRRDLSCTTCHSVHDFKSEDGQLREATQMAVCASCHRDKIAKLDRSGHMPIREGKMECSSCHNTHGSTNVRLLRRGDSIAESCTSCHADKRGPYLWEHAPGRDGCVSCHDPHGSSNERMLVARTPMLCQRCHANQRHPSTIYDEELLTHSNVRVYGRSCVTCHANIHGSNHPSGRMFIR
jgi:DmsE family decaheme c-type cytochrome